MTLKQWFAHFRQWIQMFPIPRHDDHTWVSSAFTGRYECWTCDAKFYDPNDDDSEAGEKFYEKYPHLDDAFVDDTGRTSAEEVDGD